MKKMSVFIALGRRAFALVLLAASGAWADEIHLTDKTKVTGEVLQVDDDRVVIGVPRTSVATVNGRALPAALKEGSTAPTFSVTDLAGKTQAIGTPTQGRVSVLHFWVHWCPHCRSDAPKVQALYDRFRDNPKVQLLTVNLDQDRAKVEAFIQEHHATYPVILASEQSSAPGGVDLPELYQIHAFPITFLIDAQGVIRHKVSGSFAESGQDLDALIVALLPTPPPTKSR